MNIKENINKAIPHLLKCQYDDGHFEGELSSNTFPTSAYALVQLDLDQYIDDRLINWFEKNQNELGCWGLDPAGGSDNEATLLAKLALMEIDEKVNDQRIEAILKKIPDIKLNQWLVKLIYARYGYVSWDEIQAPIILSTMMRIGESLARFLPKALTSRIKPPTKYAPPVRLFYTDMFKNMFIAEKHTVVPLFLIMELNNENRDYVVDDLLTWLLDGRCKDGSWFRVGLITALSVMALIDAKKFGYGNEEVDRAIDEGNKWLQALRSIDGGCREAINLNVWDTSLSMVTLSNFQEYKPQIKKASKWLIKNQNDGGGWAFSGLAGGNLPSDADDTALSVLALLRSGLNKDNKSVKNGIDWLINHQAKDGGWGTFRPGAGKDVSVVSITSHAISALLEAKGFDSQIAKAINWIKSSISESGYWRDLWLSRNTYGTALAIEALIKTGNIDCDEVRRGIKWLESCQNADGGWGEDINGNKTESTIEQTAWSSYALLLGDTDSPSGKKGIDYLLSHQNPNGSWDPSCVGIYWEVIGGYSDPVYPYIFALMALNFS
jgi:squalene-hopene/tetraprenyl-beta-curcumene cyclase